MNQVIDVVCTKCSHSRQAEIQEAVIYSGEGEYVLVDPCPYCLQEAKGQGEMQCLTTEQEV